MNTPYKFGFVMEQSISGHVSYTKHLRQSLSNHSMLEQTWMLVPLDDNDLWQIVPNVSSRLSLRARSIVRKTLQEKTLDGLFYHTQMITMFSLQIMKRIPTVISLDATPLNFNQIAETYRAKIPTGVLGRLKFEWYRTIFNRAAALVAWSDWAGNSLEQDYGVNPEKIKVIRPGINITHWTPYYQEFTSARPLRLLFVGADFERKGGQDLLNAFRQGLSDFCELDIVTLDKTVQSEKSVRVYHGLPHNGPELKKLFADADIFLFPTQGDSLPVAILEAMAAGLPVISTPVGAVPEEVKDGITGLLVPPKNPSAIVEAVRSMANDPTRLIAMGRAGRERVENLFNAQHNSESLANVLKESVQGTSASREKILA